MADYRPSSPFTCAMFVFKPTYINHNGVRVPEYPNNGFKIYGTFKTYGGTEQNIDGIFSVIDTAEIETWFRPDITSDCVITLSPDSNVKYRIIGDPENINRRNQFLKFRVQRDKGGA